MLTRSGIARDHRQRRRPFPRRRPRDRNPDGWLERIVERKDATAEERASVHEFNVGVYCFDGSRLVEELDKIKDDNKAGEFYLTDIFLHLKPVTVVKLDDPSEAMGIKDRVRLARATDIARRRLLGA